MALVTGASRGLGLEIVKGLAASGALVLVNGRNLQSLQPIVAELEGQGLQAAALPFDVADDDAVAGAFDLMKREYGRLDILVNNVGIRDRRKLDEFELDDVRRLFDVNLVSPFNLARRAVKLMRELDYGRIINMTSIAGLIARADDTPYITAKGGFTALTKALAAELGQYNITVNGIAPGYFATETNAYMLPDPRHVAWLQQRTSLGRWGKPEEIVGAAIFLASPAASYITGHTLIVDGGYMSHW